MHLHKPSGRWRLGLLLALVTAGFWSTLPVALKLSLERLDPITLTWARFAFAAVVIGAWLAWRGELKEFRYVPRRGWVMLLVAGTMLITAASSNRMERMMSELSETSRGDRAT